MPIIEISVQGAKQGSTCPTLMSPTASASDFNSEPPTYPATTGIKPPASTKKENMDSTNPVQRGCFSWFGCCGTHPEPVKQKPIDSDHRYFFSQRILRELGLSSEELRSPETTEKRIEEIQRVLSGYEPPEIVRLILAYDASYGQQIVDMTIVGKIIKKEGDSRIDFVGYRIAALLGYQPTQLLKQDISYLFANEKFAAKHKQILASFVASASSTPEASASTPQHNNRYLKTAPTGERNFMLKGGNNESVEATFRLKTIAISRKDSADLCGIYTAASFFAVSPPPKSVVSAASTIVAASITSSSMCPK
jgi:hypothetical protein